MSAVLDKDPQPKTASLAELRRAAAPESQLPMVRADFFDLQGFELLQRVAKAFAASSLVPEVYRGNLPNCMIALNLARRMNADELMVMQNLYIVHGNPGWSSKFLIACVNTCGRFSALRYEWRDTNNPTSDTYGCRAWAIEKETGERLNGTWIDWKLVKAEGWPNRNGSKWKTMPDQMFVYRSAAFWQRAYAPEISMGLGTAEELGDVYDAQLDRGGQFIVHTDDLRQPMPIAGEEIVEGQAPAADQKPKPEPEDGRTVIDWIAGLDECDSHDAITDYTEKQVPEGVRTDDRFTKAAKKRLDAIKAKK